MFKSKKIKRKLGNFPFISVLFSSTISVFVVGLFGLLVLFYINQADIIKKNINVQVYLKREVNDSVIHNLIEKIGQQPYVLKENGVAKVEFISKDDAAKKFIKDLGEDFIAFLGENPLRDALLVYIDSQFSDAVNLKSIKSYLENLEGVFEVNYFENLIENIHKNLRKIGVVLFILSFLLILATIVLINNSIKLALYSQRFLIRSMQLVGATNFFIVKPFMMRAFIVGFLSGFISTTMLVIFLYYLNRFLVQYDLGTFVFEFTGQILYLGILMILMGIVISIFSTYFSVKKYLHMRLDELY